MLIKELFAKVGFEFDENAFAKAERSLEVLGKGLAGVAAAAVGAGVGFAYMVGQLAEGGAEVSRAAQKAGLTTDALQELRFAAKRAGLDAEALEHGIGHLAHTMVEAQQGSVEAAYTLQRVGVSATDSSGRVKSADQILEEMADRFHKMPDGIQKTGLAMAVFGRAGKELIPFLDKGRAGIEELRQRARALGVVMDSDLIERSKQYRQSSMELSAALDGLKIALVGPFLGASKIKDALTAWIVANRTMIAQGFLKFVKALGEVFKAVWHTLQFIGYDLKGIYLVLRKLGDAFGGFGERVVAAMAIAVGAFLLISSPILLTIGAIALLILAIDDLFVYLKGGKSVIGDYLIPAFQNFFETKMLDWITKAKSMLHNGFKDIQEDAAETLLGAFGVKGKVFGETSTENDASKWDRIKGWFGGGAPPVPGASTSASSNVTVGDIIIQGANKDPQNIAGEVKRAIQDFHNETWRKTNAAVGGAR